MKLTLKNLLTSRYSVVIILLFTSLLFSPIFKVGFQSDDYFQRAIFLDKLLVQPTNKDLSLFGLFSFFSGDAKQIKSAVEIGSAPWWTLNTMKLAFWRPLTELTMWIEYKLWPNSSAQMHLQNLLWFLATIVLLSFLYHEFLDKAWVGTLALLIFSLDSDHGIDVGWICQRGALLGTFFGVITLLLHHRQRVKDWPIGAYLAPCAFLCALLSAEFAVGIVAYLFSYAIFYDQKNHRLQRLIKLWPYALVIIVWRVIHSQGGFGTYANWPYIDPLNNPVAFSEEFVSRYILSLFNLWTFFPAEVFPFLAIEDHAAFWLIACGFLAILGVILWPLLSARRSCRFWLCAILLTLLPNTATAANSRMLLLASIGSAALLAELFEWGWNTRKQHNQYQHIKNQLTVSTLLHHLSSLIILLLFICHLILKPLLLPVTAYSPYLLGEQFKKPIETLPMGDEVVNKEVIFVNPPIAAIAAAYSQYRHLQNLPIGKRNWILSSQSEELLIHRVGDNIIELEAKKSLTHVADQRFRPDQFPLSVGDTFSFDGVEIEVLETADNIHPRRVRYIFSNSLDSSKYHFIIWQDQNKPSVFRPPAIGQSVLIKPTSTPFTH